jgi:hypothetical protein
MEEVNKLTSTAEVVKLVSTDGQIFFVNKEVAQVSKLLRKSLEENKFKEGKTQEIKLSNMTS